MKESLKNTLESLLRTELEVVYVTTSNKKFLQKNDAIKCEMVSQEKREIIKKKRLVIMKIHEIIAKVLSKNDWGVFFKAEPLQDFPVQEGSKM